MRRNSLATAKADLEYVPKVSQAHGDLPTWGLEEWGPKGGDPKGGAPKERHPMVGTQGLVEGREGGPIFALFLWGLLREILSSAHGGICLARLVRYKADQRKMNRNKYLETWQGQLTKMKHAKTRKLGEKRFGRYQGK